MSVQRVPLPVGSNSERRPLGIVTSNTLVKHVIVDGMDKSEPVSQIMASPVFTISPHASATAATLLMLRERIGQVCVTEDGTPDTKALDVLHAQRPARPKRPSPRGLVAQIRFAKSPARFRELCDEIQAIAQSYLDAGALRDLPRTNLRRTLR